MKINEYTLIQGDRILLHPYTKELVLKYHSWMEDDELRRLTGSERLTLEQEYSMQKTWREDKDKCTFIILSAEEYRKTESASSSMVGDVNLFLQLDDDSAATSAEVEVMIAEPSARGCGFANEAVRLIISYAIHHLNISKFFVKITDDNVASLALFQKKLGFHIVSHSEVFGEYTLELPQESVDQFRTHLDNSKIVQLKEGNEEKLTPMYFHINA